MKKIIVFTVIILLFGYLGHFEALYKREAKVIDIQGNKITCLDNTNRMWTYTIGKKDKVQINDNIILIMDDRHTDTLADDIVVDIK